MLKALMRVRLASLKSWFFGGTRKKKITRGRLIGMSALMLYAFCAIGFLLYSSFVQLATAYRQMGLEWLYFAMFFLLDFGLIFIGSVFTAKAQLFEARDNELLSSMPIPPGYILTSRMLLLWALGLFYGLLAAIPAGLAWCASGPVTAAGLAAFIVIVLLLKPCGGAFSVNYPFIRSIRWSISSIWFLSVADIPSEASMRIKLPVAVWCWESAGKVKFIMESGVEN